MLQMKMQKNGLRFLLFYPKKKLEDLIEEHQLTNQKEFLQKRLAKELTIFVHGEEEYNKQLKQPEKLFVTTNAPVQNL